MPPVTHQDDAASQGVAAWEQPGVRTIEARVTHLFFFLWFFFDFWGFGLRMRCAFTHGASVREAAAEILMNS